MQMYKAFYDVRDKHNIPLRGGMPLPFEDLMCALQIRLPISEMTSIRIYPVKTAQSLTEGAVRKKSPLMYFLEGEDTKCRSKKQ